MTMGWKKQLGGGNDKLQAQEDPMSIMYIYQIKSVAYTLQESHSDHLDLWNW